jgi:hypothetical protein
MCMQVAMGDDNTYLVIGVGTVPIRMSSGDVHVLQNVHFVSGLAKNLFFILAITELKCKVAFDEKWCIIRDFSQEPGFWPKEYMKDTFIGFL